MSTPALNPLVEKIRGAHPGVYDDMDDATLTKRVLAKYPQYSDLAAPSVPKPQVNMQEAPPAPPFDLGDFSARVGERIKQNVNIIPSIIKGQGQPGAAQAAREMTGLNAPTTLGKIAGVATIGPRLVGSMLKGYAENPAAIAGDVVLASPELSEARMPASRQAVRPVPAPPAELPLSPEQQASYTAALDKTNASFAAKSQAYHGKVSEAFDTAKQQHLDELAQHQQKVQDIQTQHAANVAQAQQEFEAATQKEQAARAAHEQRVQAAQQSREQAAALEERRQQITQARQAMAEDTRQQAQAMYQNERNSLDARWDAVREQVGADTPTPIEGVADAMNKAEREYLRGSPGSVLKFRQLATELGLGDMFGVEEGDVGTTPAGKFYEVNPEMATAPWQTIRTHASSIGRAMASGDLGNVYPAMRLVRNALEDVAGRVAEEQGAGDAYRAVRTDEAQFRKDFEDLGPVSIGKGNPAARLIRAPNANFASDIIHGKASDLLTQALARWDKSGQLPTNIQQMHVLADELKNLPKVKVLPEPPAYTGQAPTLQQVPAPTLPEQPTIPQKKPPVAPTLGKVTRPIPEPPPAPKPGFIRKHIAPKLGGIAAATTNLPFPGHSLGNYAIGSELTRVGLEKMATRRSMPPTREAYTRTILAAKEGEISPGEADRRIVRAGGRVKVKPIPQPPVEPEPTTPSVAPSAESKVNDFISQAFTRATQEGAGQEVLDRMTEAGESPIELNRHFWSDTFNRLPPEVQNRFTRYLKKETGGMQPGDTIGVTKDRQPIVAKSWADIANNILDLSHDPQKLEGTTRGLVTLMRIAVEKFPARQTRRIGPLPQLHD